MVATGTPAALKRQIADQRLDLTLADDSAFRQVVDRLGRLVITADPVQRVVSVPTDGAAAGIRRLLDEVDPEVAESPGSRCTWRRWTTSSWRSPAAGRATGAPTQIHRRNPHRPECSEPAHV